MQALNFSRGQRVRFLCVGAHADDIEIGCGGTLLELIGRCKAHVTWLVLSGSAQRHAEARKSAARFLKGAVACEVRTESFRDGFFPSEHEPIKSCFEAMARQVSPDVIFTHTRDDLHQDHRVVAELTWNTFRSHLIFEYEIPKYDGDVGRPNAYVPLSRGALRRKIAALMSIYGSQANKHWFTPDTFEGLARLRGIECRSPSGYAEAFYARKIVLGTG